MARVDVWNWNREKVGAVELPDEVFEYPYRRHLVWGVVKAHLAGLRAGTHKTKTRAEVSGSGRKPFRQKGTGRARQGGNRPPIHRHGGTTFGPTPRSYAHRVSVGEKKNALRSVLSRKLKEARLLVVEEFKLGSHHTKDLLRNLSGLGIEGKALLVESRENENLARASRNVGGLKHVDPLAVNCYDVLSHGYLITTREALARVAHVLGGGGER
jgi:large subunit ribosomal protein L4